MGKRARGTSFLLEPSQPVGIRRVVCVQDLDGDIAVEARIAGPIHATHATGTNQGVDLVRSHRVAGFELETVSGD